MRWPLHDTAQGYRHAPRAALAADEALLDAAPAERWYVVDRPAIVVGLGLHRRVAEVLDLERCARAGLEVLQRRAGGGAVLLDQHLLCYAVALPLPHPLAPDDLTASYRWLGERFAAGLQQLGVPARRVEVDEARADVARLRAGHESALLAACYGALSPHEVVVDGLNRKLVGLAQVRRRHAALFQAGVLLRDQSRLAEFLLLPDDRSREAVRASLRARTVGLEELIDPPPLDRLVALLNLHPAAA